MLWPALRQRDNDREVLQADQKATCSVWHEDKPIYYDNWDVDIFYTENTGISMILTSMKNRQCGYGT